MYDKHVVNYLHPDESLCLKGYLSLEAIDERRVKLIYKDATEERIGMQHDDFVAETSDHDLVLLAS